MNNSYEYYINRCIQISKKGISLASPNPCVGAVLVYEDKTIGEGYTSPFGGAHAEVNCISSVNDIDKKLISKSTLYVSLEPCSHIGKTSACSTLIIEKGIQKIVIGSLDPNPLVAGKGVEMLKEKGLDVIVNVLKDECEASNKRFYIFHKKKRPYIILKWAETKNAYFSPADESQFWITNKYIKQLVHKWRTEEMAILVGTNTARIDNPQLNSRFYSGNNPLRIVIDKDLKLSQSLHLFNQQQNTLIFNDLKSEKNNKLEYCKIDFTQSLIKQILDYLHKLEINSVIIEGGLKTLNSFIEQNYWDEARVLIGNNEREKGLKAPILNGKLIEEFSLKGDQYKQILNLI